MTKNRFDKIADLQKEEYLPQWHGNKKRPAYIHTEEPIFLMSKAEPTTESNRAYGITRNDVMATPTYDDEIEDPLANYASHWHTPETWETLQQEAFPGSEKSVLFLTEKARYNMKNSFREYLEHNNDTITINQPSIIDTIIDKEQTGKHLRNNNLPTIPSINATEILYEDQEYIEDKIGYADQEIILKPKKGRGGEGIKEFDSLKDLNEFLDNRTLTTQMAGKDVAREEYLEDYLIQPKIPHNSDLRLITAGDNIINAARRIPPESDFKTNISDISSEINGQDLSVHGKALNGLKQGRLQPIDVKKSERISEEVKEILEREDLMSNSTLELAEETIYSFNPEEFNYDSDLSQTPLFMGIDVLETDLEELESLPQEYIDDIREFTDGNQAYVITELKHQPGTTIDALARITGNPEQISALNLYNVMRDLAGLETLDIDSITEDPENPTWRRVEAYYPNIEDNMEQFVEDGKKTAKNFRS